jgi:hypothetical protein
LPINRLANQFTLGKIFSAPLRVGNLSPEFTNSWHAMSNVVSVVVVLTLVVRVVVVVEGGSW